MWRLSERLSVSVNNGCVEIDGYNKRFVLTPRQWFVLPLNKVRWKLEDREAALYRLPYRISVQCLPRVVFIERDPLFWDPDYNEKLIIFFSPEEWMELVQIAGEISSALCRC